MPVGKLPATHGTDFRAHSLPVLRLRMGVVPSGSALWGAELSWPAFMVRHDCSSALRTEGKRHVLDHLSRAIFHLSSPSFHFSPFLRRFLWKISKYIRKAAKQRSALSRQVELLLRRPIHSRLLFLPEQAKAHEKLKNSRFFMCSGSFRENERHQSRSSDALAFTLFILRR